MALLTTQPLTWATSLLSAALMPRFLGDQVLGQYSLAMAMTSIVGLLLLLGLPASLSRRIAVDPQRAAIEGPAALVLLLALASILGGIFIVVVSVVGLAAVPVDVLRLAIMAMVLATASNVLTAVLVGQQRFVRSSWFNAGVGVLGVWIGMAVLASGGGLVGYLLSSLVTTAVVIIIGWANSGYRPGRAAVDLQLWRGLVRSGLPFLGWDLALRVYGEIDKIILAFFAPGAVIGWYAAALRITAIPVFVPTLVTTPLLPVLSRCKDDPAVFTHTLRRSLVAVLFLTVPLSAGLVALAPTIPDLLGWGPSFVNSVPLLSILAFQQPLVGVDMVLGTALFALHREGRWFRVALVAAVFNPALNLLLVPYFEQTQQNGAIGAALVTVAGDLLMLVGALMLLPRGTLDRQVASMGVRIVVAGACLACAVMVVNTRGLAVQLAVGGIVYVAAVLALRVFGPAELVAMRQLVLDKVTRRAAASCA